METITVSEENIESLKATIPSDQAKMLEIGCVVQKWIKDGLVHTLTLWPDNRGAYATNGPSIWGDWDESGHLATDDHCGYVEPGKGLVCPWSECDKEPCEPDCDGDLACQMHAEQSFDWVVVTNLENGTFIDQRLAERMSGLLSEEGWAVCFQSPKRGQAEGTYCRREDGTLQMVGFSIPKPEALTLAIEEAYEKAVRS